MALDDVANTDADKKIVARLRTALTQAQYTRNPNQVYDNLDSDAQIPDQLKGKPASRRELLDQLQKENPGQENEVQDVFISFCRAHHKEGTEHPNYESVTLGRVWKLDGMVAILQGGGATPAEAAQDLDDMIRNQPVQAQRERLRDTPLCRFETMWAFHDPTTGSDPFGKTGRSRYALVNRLGLGQYNQGAGLTTELICWGHILPPGTTAHAPTAWDAEDSPHWRPGGSTYPLVGNAAQGLPEAVHSKLTGAALAVKIEYVR